MLYVALTGGIGSGKTTVAQFFAEFGIPIVDADEIAHQITAPNAPILTEIVEHFGKKILNAYNNTLNRHQLRKIVFQHPKEKEWLENILHPPIRKIMRERAKQASGPYCILVIPLLIESQDPIDIIDRICVVDAPKTLQRQRIQCRNTYSHSEITRMIRSQSSREQRLAKADDVIHNNQDLPTLRQQVQQLHHYYLSLSDKMRI